MTIKSYFYDSIDGDRAYSAMDFSRAFDTFLDNGVISENQYGGLGMEINPFPPYTTIGQGKAIINGHFVEITAPEPIPVPTGTYSGMLVIRVDPDNARSASLVMRTDRNPIQTSTIYELPLYNTYVLSNSLNNVVDVRQQGGARTINPANSVTWEGVPGGVRVNMGKFDSEGKAVILYLTSSQPQAHGLEHRVWIQIDEF